MDPPAEWKKSICFFSLQEWQSTWNMVAFIFPNIFPFCFLSDAAISSTVSWELIEGHSRHTPTYTFVFFLQRQIFYITYQEKQTVNSCQATACLPGFPGGHSLVQTQVQNPFLGISFSLFVLVFEIGCFNQNMSVCVGRQGSLAKQHIAAGGINWFEIAL